MIDLKKNKHLKTDRYGRFIQSINENAEADIILFIHSHSRIVIPLFGGRIKTLQQEDTSQHEEKTNSREQTSVIVWLMTK